MKSPQWVQDWPVAWLRDVPKNGGVRWRCTHLREGYKPRYWLVVDYALTVQVFEFKWHGGVHQTDIIQNDYDLARRKRAWERAEAMGAPPRPADWAEGCRD